MKKFLLIPIVALVAVFALPSIAQAGDEYVSASVAEVETVDAFSNISIYVAGTYRVSGVDAGGALLGVSYDFDFLSPAFEYAYTDIPGGVHEYNLLLRKYADFGGINPYAVAGGGLLRYGSDSYAQAVAGVGLELELTDSLAAFGEYRYQWVFDNKDVSQFVFGLSYRF